MNPHPVPPKIVVKARLARLRAVEKTLRRCRRRLDKIAAEVKKPHVDSKAMQKKVLARVLALRHGLP